MFVQAEAPRDQLTIKLIPLLRQASQILVDEYNQYISGQKFDIEKKSDNSPVTQADYKVNQFLTQALAEISELPLLSEEATNENRKNWKKFWLLDPLDGTKEFLHKRAEFTINLSLVDNAQTVYAVIVVPCENTMYIATEVGLPYKLDIKNNQWFKYSEQHINSEIKVGLSQSSQSKPQYAQFLEQLNTITPFITFKAGSAYKFCMILEDKVDIYPRFHPTCEWDTSAGQCLIERIGGGLIDFNGKSFTYNQRDTLLNNGFLAYKNNEMRDISLKALELMANIT